MLSLNIQQECIHSSIVVEKKYSLSFKRFCKRTFKFPEFLVHHYTFVEECAICVYVFKFFTPKIVNSIIYRNFPITYVFY
jgi:hypothetical protein